MTFSKDVTQTLFTQVLCLATGIGISIILNLVLFGVSLLILSNIINLKARINFSYLKVAMGFGYKVFSC